MGAYLGIIYFNFHCISNSPSPSADISKGRMYINKVWLFDENNKTEDRRCAVSILCLKLGLPTSSSENLFKFVIKSTSDTIFQIIRFRIPH